MKRSISLNGEWRMKPLGEDGWLNARVPGSVYTDLLAAGRMEDPFYRDNEYAAFDLMEKDYVYEKTFVLTEEESRSPSLDLVFAGLDTLAEVYLNRRLLFRADNMHRTWRTDIRPFVKAGENVLRVLFYSPNRAAREAFEKNHAAGSSDALDGFTSIRKAHCMYGWDWGPRLPDAGIWRDVKLEITDRARLESVMVRQQHEKNRVLLSMKAEVCALTEGTKWRAVYSLTDPEETVVFETEQSDVFVDHPRLWWPLGVGDQPLYTLKTKLYAENGDLLDEDVRRIGLRTIIVDQPKQEGHEGFMFRVNGQDIFAMGADYIPQDCLLPRVTEEKIRDLLLDCARVHMNCLRVWGGGYYLPDCFYDRCDELGILVWQDFMFACGVYSLEDGMEENLRAEFRDNIVRLRHHASIALWCGNNEVETAVRGQWYPLTPALRRDYQRIFMGILPETIRRLDPDRFYWPSSPSSNGDFLTPSDEACGDVHYWDVWHGNKPFSDYRNHDFGFVSEFGFQSFPSMKTIESFTLPEDRNIFSYVMEKHQRNHSANGKIMNYLSSLYLYPSNLDLLVYASQLMQMEAIRCGVEHWRSRRGTCMGAVYWQLNDNWPVASWASIDYFGRWKALHYGAARFFAPLLLACEEEGEHTQRGNVNSQLPMSAVVPGATLTAVNDTREDVQVLVRWKVCRADGSETELQGEEALAVPAFSAVKLQKLSFPGFDPRKHFLSYAMSRDGETVSESTVLFCPPKYFPFEDPELTVVQDGEYLTVRAKRYARMVEINGADGDAVLSDNDFDMLPGEKTIRIVKGGATRWTVRSVFDIK